MRTAGKALTAGFFGSLGATAAIAFVGVTLALIGERVVKNAIADIEKFLRESTDRIMDTALGDEKDDR